MFGFLKKKKLPKQLDSDVVDFIRAKYSFNDHLIKYHATEENDWIDFQNNKHSFPEFSRGVLWLCALDIYDEIIRNPSIEPKFRHVPGNLLFLECVLFLFFSIMKLDTEEYLNYYDSVIPGGGFCDFGENVVSLIYEDVRNYFDMPQTETEDFLQDRLELYLYMKGEVTDWRKALCYQFTKVIRSRADMSTNHILNTNVNEYHIAMDHDLQLGIQLISIAEIALNNCIDIMKRTMDGYEEYNPLKD